jgi:hypothetical protein
VALLAGDSGAVRLRGMRITTDDQSKAPVTPRRVAAILVTKAGGLIDHNLAKRLVAEGSFVRAAATATTRGCTRVLGWELGTTLSQGLVPTYQWIVAQCTARDGLMQGPVAAK